ncbi:hypothetical protein GCM10020254_48970 [Streptomyces goshikiensis]
MNHGVTTVAAGNCGFTLAPLNPARPEDADYTRRMMSKVEGMALKALEEGVDWSWSTFGEYLDALDGRIAVNAGFMVGHCALRRHVMGEDAIGGQPTPEQLGAMLDLFHDAMNAGAWGLSTTQSATHSDGAGAPRRLPPRPARRTPRPVEGRRRARGHPAGGDRRRLPRPVLRRGDRPVRRDERGRRAPPELERPHHRRLRPRTRPAPADTERARPRGRRPDRRADHADPDPP